MGATSDAEMDADEAAGLLAGLEEVEETVTARTAGLTWLVWGTAIPGLFVSYQTATTALASTGFEWILSVLWIPWVVGASLTTTWLWRATAVRMEWETSGREGWLYSLGFTLAFLALAGTIVALAGATGVALADHEWMTLAGGLLTVVIGAVYHRSRTPGVGEALAGGTVIAAGGVVLAVVEIQPAGLEALAAAGLVGAVYYAMGARLFLEG